jgi:simple sugar transport system ATP-binding protein
MNPRPEINRLELRGITRRFGALVANDGIDLAVAPGEIHALLGENGAGKSTLMNIVYGVLQADEGEMLWEGKPVGALDPHAARRLGIGMVFQHFSLFEAMSVAENIALVLDRPGPMATLSARISSVSAQYGLPLDPAREVHSLSVGERQRVEIVRCLLQAPRLLVMDEPTSVLTPQEASVLFETLRRLAAEGVSILYISHKLDEIRDLCSRATVLRHGRVVGRCDPRRETAATLARMMVGADVLRVETAPDNSPGERLLSLYALSLPAPGPFDVALREISLEVRAGEIVGIAGIAGNGQGELMAAISGERAAPNNNDIQIGATMCGRLGAAARRRLGLATVPEERNGHAAMPGLTLAENTVLTGRERAGLVRLGMVRGAATRAFARRIIDDFDVRQGRPAARAGSLSGGNLQKFVVGREVLQQPLVLVIAQPTWGVDAGAAAAIHRALFERARAGSAVLVISQDLDELLRITNRIAVLHEGRLSRPLPTHAVTMEQLGLMMGGVAGVADDATAELVDAV